MQLEATFLEKRLNAEHIFRLHDDVLSFELRIATTSQKCRNFMCLLHAAYAGPDPYQTNGAQKISCTLAHRLESAFDEPFFNLGKKNHVPYALEFYDGCLFAIKVVSQKKDHAKAWPLPPRGNATPVRTFQQPLISSCEARARERKYFPNASSTKQKQTVEKMTVAHVGGTQRASLFSHLHIQCHT